MSVKKKKLVEWQKTREIINPGFDSDLNTAASQAVRMALMAREVLTEQQFAAYDGIMNKQRSFTQIAKTLNVSVPRVSELWHTAVDKVEYEWRERNKPQ